MGFQLMGLEFAGVSLHSRRLSREFVAISQHSGQLGVQFGDILRIRTNFRRIEAGVTVEQLAHWGFGASKGTRQARRRAGSRHVTTRRFTLNQRVRGSSPRGLTTTFGGSGIISRSHLLCLDLDVNDVVVSVPSVEHHPRLVPYFARLLRPLASDEVKGATVPGEPDGEGVEGGRPGASC